MSTKIKNIIEINKALYLNDYKLKLFFNDGKKKVIDLDKFLKSAKNPMTRKFIDKKNFKQFKVEYGDLVWEIMKCVFRFGIYMKGKSNQIIMEKEIKIWYDREGDYLEVLFDIKPGFFKETKDSSIMEKVDNDGNVLGFSIL